MSKAPIKRSGHARLKAALVLRDALAGEIGLRLPAAMAQLRTVEETCGAAPGLAQGRYLEALASLSHADGATLTRLDSQVSQACSLVQFAPRYAQYLALMLFACWVDAQLDDQEALRARLNAWLAAHPPKGESVPAFTPGDLQLAAFWMATAAGKTHLLHACLALLERRRPWGRMLVVTPSEALTRQHAERLRRLGTWDVFAYPLDGEAAALGRLPPETVIVLDINKLTAQKRGDGVTVPTHVFSDGRNLVFVDEGHKGQRAEASVWKALQADLAGIDAPEPTRRGLLIEFSATFGQVAEGEHAFDRYAKAVIFDYAYDRFHRDRYGKDFWHVRVQADGDAGRAAQQQTLTAALLAFWHQVACFRSADGRRAALAQGLELAAPLWVLLGLSVIGSTKNEGDKEQTSDVVDVLRFLCGILAAPADLTDWLTALLAAATVSAESGVELLPPTVRGAATGYAPPALAAQLLGDCFGWQPGDKPVLRLIGSTAGELGLGLRRGDQTHYYGVVNVGDAGGLKRALEAVGLMVEEDALSGSLFAAIDTPGSGLNCLIGSRRFAEGWDNYRASSLTLLRLGQGEGSLIIQMFGRVVRLAGVHGDGKRLERPPAVLAPLQTAYVYGLKSRYLDAFLNGLIDNGAPESQRIECAVQAHTPPILQAVRAITPGRGEFQVAAQGGAWLAGLGTVSVSLTAAISTSRLADGQVQTRQGTLGQDITAEFRQRLNLVDQDGVWRDLIEWRRVQHRWNLTFDRAAIGAALADGHYQIQGLPGQFAVRTAADLARINRLATTLVQRLLEAADRRAENRLSRYALTALTASGIPDRYFKEIAHGD
ncbi:DEAD/DEAH box helicase family protein [uncultured Thiodictyon sp.]|uniref:DEAD/DEAH box helicase family protein n=1 Tax=uncultured Thiodictyon sp. TaxID=1846217 RepID=UPI0025E95493|nr:DEAD/DEAH box helicase family protein [uncultured Thiodictyon sp.]